MQEVRLGAGLNQHLKKLKHKKIFEKESNKEDFLEDSMELSEESKRHIEKSIKEIADGRVSTLEQIKKKFKM